MSMTKDSTIGKNWIPCILLIKFSLTIFLYIVLFIFGWKMVAACLITCFFVFTSLFFIE